MSLRNSLSVSPKIVLVIGVVAVSTAPIFIRLAQREVPSLAIATWRMTLASFFLLPFVFRRGQIKVKKLKRVKWGFMVISGLFLAIHFATMIVGLSLTSVAILAVLVTTHPLFVALFSYLYLNEAMSRSKIVGIAIAFMGIIVIATGEIGQGTHNLMGDLLALVSAVTMAGYLLIGRQMRKQLPLSTYIFLVYAIAAFSLLITIYILEIPLIGYSTQTWIWILLLSLIPQVIGHSLLNWALRYVTATIVSLQVLAAPVIASFLAWIVLSETPTLITIFGAFFVLYGIFIANHLSKH